MESDVKSILSPNAEHVAQKRYYHKDDQGKPVENWEGLSHRVVDYVCCNETEQFKEQIFDLIHTTKFLPNSPCLVNAGRKGKSRGLFGCFVSKSPDDSWVGMVENIANFGHIARQGGGAGISLSKIRPEGDSVFGSTHAKACGPIEHMRMVSEVMTSITQSGFRGMAIMMTLDVNHPDIMKFIVCKQRERALKSLLKEDIYNHYDKLIEKNSPELNIILDKFIYNCNISVVVNDAFMTAVEKDENWDLKFNGKIYETLKARTIFNAIVENAWKNGDPGLLFWNKINDGPYKYSGQVINATNPCFHGDSLVAIAGRGFTSIKQLAEEQKDIPVYCCDRLTGGIHVRMGRNPRKTRESAELCKVTFDDGGSIITTPDHQILLRSGEYMPVKDLSQGSVVMTLSPSLPRVFDAVDSRKVSSIDHLTKTAAVYNITVDDYHNLCILNKSKNDINLCPAIVYKNCGEQPLVEHCACNLGSLDVSKFFDKEKNDLDWKQFARAIHVAIQFLDDVIDVNVWPTPAFEKTTKENRPVGLGIMGFADLLLKLKLAYGSEESIKFAEKTAKFLENEAHKKSVELGKERGTPKACQYEELEFRRNVTLTSIAPTGTIAQLADCSHAIEPHYSETVFRHDNTGEKQLGTHPLATKPYFRCAISSTDPAKQVTWKQHIDIQAAFQKYGSSGVSKTINMPSDATIQDVAEAFVYAYKQGCKGITIFRDRSKTTQVLTTGNTDSRPKSLPCQIYKTRAEGVDWHVIVGLLNDRPYELFAINGRVDLPKQGYVVKRKRRYYSLMDENEAVLIENLSEEENHISPKISLETRRFSLELRNGICPEEIVEQIDKSTETMSSFSKAVSRIFKKSEFVNLANLEIMCPECAKEGKEVPLIPTSGCYTCKECTYSRCG